MARKWHLFFRRLQSLLSKRYALWCCGLAMLWLCVTVQPFSWGRGFANDSAQDKPSILIGMRVNAASSSVAVSSNGDLIDRAQQLYQSGNYPQAIELLKRSIDINRADPLKQAIVTSKFSQ
jgi:hypothetical protein